MKSPFSVGASRVPFTPDPDWYPLYRNPDSGPESLPPEQRENQVLTVSLDEMYARAVAIRNEQMTALIVTIDYIGPLDGPEKVLLLSERFGIAPENIYFIATHAHNVPMTDRVPRYLSSAKMEAFAAAHPRAMHGHKLFRERLDHAIGQAVEEALAALRPATMGYGRADSYVNVNRDLRFAGEYMMGHNWAGVSDKTASLIRFADAEGKTIARLANYACHAVAMYLNRCGENGTGGASSDLPGFVSRTFEEQDPGSVCLWTPAAGGNQNPVYMNFLSYPDPVTGKVREELLDPGNYQILRFMGLRHYNDLRAAEAGMGEYAREIDIGARRTTRTIPIRPREAGGKETFELLLSALRLGDVLLYGIGGELYCDVGMYLKELSPVPNTLICTLCVGSAPYMMSDADLAAPTLFARRTPWLPGTLVPAMEGFLREVTV